MPNVILQDLNAVIHGTSRHGLEYDVAHVSILLQTDSPITPDLQWAIPHIEDIPQKAITLIKDGKTAIYPVLKSKARESINDFFANVDSNNVEGTLEDIEQALLLASMRTTTIEPLENNDGRYIVSYKYRLYPAELNTFDFKVVLPFDGLGLASGNRLQVTVVSPMGSTIDPVFTDAKDFQGQSVANESITTIPLVGKQVTSFEIHQDPIFTIRYRY
ncbi:hypothetical protein JHL18_00495 [Clostridium sp. YIM B02505]|uniref:Uncharacterized protein n=1 Tax=Clostridium yunnanense TaxID=2800325 RepID=A0ABS1EID7_9CLOT|nr:hypothetical protein [Clostridium yunnanense]MBK1809127.1 hypothetical protein [Clostridium yunnanense]